MNMLKQVFSVSLAMVTAMAVAEPLELDLSGEWRGSLASDVEGIKRADFADFKYAVPGGVQSSLLAAKLIPDTFIGTNEVDNLWIGKSDWRLSREFEVDAAMLAKKIVLLRLEDCDAVATIFVNGKKVGATSDRFMRYEFDVRSCLKPGKNRIEGLFRGPETYADERSADFDRVFPMSNVMWARNQSLIRKPACHAGWDWGPSVQVIGFCGTVRLIASDRPIIEYVYTHQDFNADFSHCTLTVTVELSDGSKVVRKIEIDKPELWWPNGVGDQKFHTYTIDVNGEKLTRTIGLRKVEVLNEKSVSKDGKEELSLVFRVNGRRVFMKGANWIPSSAYENAQTPAMIENLLESARAAHMNMIRVWGGGQYEKDLFYDLCDRKGLLLWHDMMCSCAVYPGDEKFLSEIRSEVTHQLKRLRDHACIAMWCGDNECLGSIKWFEETRKDPDYYRNCWIARSKMQGELVAEFDPDRTYWPSSPCCGPGDFGDGWKEDSKGDMHNWDVWHENQPFDKYYEYHPRFCSEFGFQSFPSMEIAETFATREQILARAPEFEWHQKNKGGNERIRKTMKRYFPDPKDVPNELLLSQFQQAMAIQTAVDAWRAEQPRCMGTLFWQLNDNWPVASWSSVEYGGKWKPLQYLAKRFFSPLHIVRAPDGTVSVINDTAKPLTGKAVATFYGFDGKKCETLVLAEEATLEANAATKVGMVGLRPGYVLKLEFTGCAADEDRLYMASNYPVFDTYRGISIPKAKVATKVNGFSVTLSTDKPALWVWLNVKGIAGEFDDNAVTLVPGEERTFRFVPADPKVTAEAFTKALTVTHLAEVCK